MGWLANSVFAQPELAIRASNIHHEWFKTTQIFSQISSTPPPIPLPEQDLLLLCTNNNHSSTAEGGKLYRHNLASNQWTKEDDLSELMVMIPFLNDSAVVLQGFNELPVGPNIWENGESVQSIINEEGPLLSFGHFHPSGQLLAYQLGNLGGSIIPQLIDLSDCQHDQQCTTEAIPGLLAWSPDGRQTITADPFSFTFNYLSINGRHYLLHERLNNQEPYTLFRSDGPAQIPIGIRL